MSRKKRILLVNEASFLSTGYSNYGYQLLKYLWNTGKYEIAELASYGSPFDERRFTLPWTYYGNGPNQQDEAEMKEYHSNVTNQFGAWRFEAVAADFGCDAVIAIRDHWMDFFINESPYRSKYHVVRMPTVDARPQHPEWIDDYQQCDRVVTYTDWAIDILRDNSRGVIEPACSCPPAVDYETFKPIQNKSALRKHYGLRDDRFIVGTVMRNQKRKLFPELILAFTEFLKRLTPQERDRAYLYLHTSYPDNGWDLPRLINEAGISHRVLFTYVCHNCNHVFPSLFHEAVCVCPKCGQYKAQMPSTQVGVSREVLAQVLNLFDLYVQYHNSEGFGIPLLEAAACGVPVCCTDYSGPEDIIRKLGGRPIRVKHLYREAETGCLRAIPDNDDLADYLLESFRKPASLRATEGFKVHKAAAKHYNWELTGSRWEAVIDSLPLLPESRWNEPSIYTVKPNLDVPQGLNNADFVRYVAENILQRPEQLSRYWFSKTVNELNYGRRVKGIGGLYVNTMSLLGGQDRWEPVTRESILQEAVAIRQHWHKWENIRLNKVPYTQPYYIKYKKPAEVRS